MKMKVKMSLKDYVLDNLTLKSTILSLKDLDAEELKSKLNELKIDTFFTEEKILLQHLDDLRQAVDEHNLVEVNSILDTIGV